MSVKRDVAKIKELKAGIERQVDIRSDRLTQHAERCQETRLSLESLYKDIIGWYEARWGRYSIHLNKRLKEAELALKEVSQ
jgi:hypothetical protein